jgi:tetratricopeptide (TPR) repeat protein
VNQFEESLNNLLEAYKVNPKSPRLVVQVGLGYQLMFDYDNAIKYYDIAINLAPDISASAYNYKSRSILLRDGDYDLSSKVLDRGILRTSDKNSIWAKTKNLTFRGEYKDALDNISKNKSDFGSFLFNASLIPKELPMAICYNGLGDKERAKKYFGLAKDKMEKQVQYSPDDYRTHAGLGIVYSHVGLKDEAIREGKTALAILPPSKDSFFGVYQVLALAYIYMTIGDYNASLDQLETVLNKFGGITVEEIENFPEWRELRNHPRITQWKQNKQRS